MLRITRSQPRKPLPIETIDIEPDKPRKPPRILSVVARFDKPRKPRTIPLTDKYRIEFICKPGRTECPSKFISAPSAREVTNELQRMRNRKEFTAASVKQFGKPVQLFLRSKTWDWYRAVKSGPLAECAPLGEDSE